MVGSEHMMIYTAWSKNKKGTPSWNPVIQELWLWMLSGKQWMVLLMDMDDKMELLKDFLCMSSLSNAPLIKIEKSISAYLW